MKKVIYAKLHSSVFIPNAGGNGKSLNTKDTWPPETSLLKNLQTFFTASGDLEIQWIGPNGEKKEGIIPKGNLAFVLTEPTSAKK